MELSMDSMNCWRNGTEVLLLLRFFSSGYASSSHIL